MSKVPQLITEHIDIWTSAILVTSGVGRGGSKKREQYGIKKLREFILELAVRGKLVPQDPTDEPASVLLGRIAVEKAELVKAKKIKKPKALPAISDDEKPFELPNGWSWVRIGDTGSIFNGNSVNAQVKEKKYTDVANGLPFIATKDVSYGFESFDYENGVSIPRGESKFKVAHRNAVLVCAEGGSAGKKCGIAEQDICFGNKLFANELYTGINSRFILASYLSPSFFSQFSNSMTGIIGGISLAKFALLVIALPPEKEQQRIIAKVDKLMLLCDQLEQQTEASIDAHGTLIETLLTTLTDSADADELAENWARIAEHFDTLFTTDKSIDALKQTILQLAVMGKLVPQNPTDEPASVLLDKIATEKAMLLQEKRIKKQKPLSSISDAEKPFGLPNGWGWCRFGSVFLELKYGTSKKSDYDTGGYAILRIPNVVNGYICTEDLKYTDLSEKDANELKLLAGDLLFIRSNGSVGIVGRCTVVDRDLHGFAYAGYLVRARLPKSDVSPTYIASVMASPLIRRQIEKPIRSTTGVNNVNSTELGNLIFPIPPREEQYRIAAKIDVLIAICDQLKDKLQQSQQTQIHLTDALIDQALI